MNTSPEQIKGKEEKSIQDMKSSVSECEIIEKHIGVFNP